MTGGWRGRFHVTVLFASQVDFPGEQGLPINASLASLGRGTGRSPRGRGVRSGGEPNPMPTTTLRKLGFWVTVSSALAAVIAVSGLPSLATAASTPTRAGQVRIVDRSCPIVPP